jgi:putative transposase
MRVLRRLYPHLSFAIDGAANANSPVAMLQWSAERNIRLQFSDPRKPTQNAQRESLKGRIRDELLSLHGFANLFEAREAAERWRIEYDEIRARSALGYRTPRESRNTPNSTNPHR